jgi:hypothetical protein
MSFLTVHFDDSGTHPEASTAIAASLVASVEQWIEFNRNWIAVEKKEGFGTFHMADFAAGHEQFQGWDDRKKKRVLEKLCNIILTRTQIGHAVSVTKRDYDKVIVGSFRLWAGRFHYTYCVRQCAGATAVWRKRHQPNTSLRYVFDRMAKKAGKGEIMEVMDAATENSAKESKRTGLQILQGYSFEDKSQILPLQAADIYAWTAFQMMQKLISGRHASDIAEYAYSLLSTHRSPLKWHFYVEENLRQWAKAEKEKLISLLRQP